MMEVSKTVRYDSCCADPVEAWVAVGDSKVGKPLMATSLSAGDDVSLLAETRG